MVDFSTLKGLDGYRAAFPTAFAGLSDTEATRVIRAVHGGVLEGWEPTESAMRDVVQRVLRSGPAMTPAELHALAAHLNTRSA